jgi:hypothetical protein
MYMYCVVVFLGNSLNTTWTITVFQTTGSEFSKKQSTRAAVEQLASSLKGQVAPGIATTIDTRMEELTEKWRNLEDKLSQRKIGEGNK